MSRPITMDSSCLLMSLSDYQHSMCFLSAGPVNGVSAPFLATIKTKYVFRIFNLTHRSHDTPIYSHQYRLRETIVCSPPPPKCLQPDSMSPVIQKYKINVTSVPVKFVTTVPTPPPNVDKIVASTKYHNLCENK